MTQNEIKKDQTFTAIIAEDKSGPAYGTGLTESEARKEAVYFGFTGGVAIKITNESFDAIQNGNPDAITEA